MKRYRQGFLIFLSFIAVCGLSSDQTLAYSGMDKIPALSYDISQPREDIVGEMILHQEVPEGDSSLEMQIRLPKEWVKEDLNDVRGSLPGLGEQSAGADIFKMLVRYVSPPRIERRSEFRARSIEINTLISLENWFVTYSLQMGFSPEGFTKKGENRIEAAYTLFVHGEPEMVRAVIQRTGNKIIIAEYMVHQENYENEKDTQTVSMVDFKLVNPNEDVMLPFQTYAFVDIAKFKYPEQWLLHTPGITTIDRMSASVISLKDIGDMEYNKVYNNYTLNGRIDILIVSKYIGTTIEKELQGIGDELKEKQLKLSEKIETIDNIPVHSLVSSVNVSTYHIIPPVSELNRYYQLSGRNVVTKNLADYEYWIAVLETSGRYYFVRLLTIGRDEDFRAWSENTEVFKSLVGSVSPVNDTVH